MMLMILVGHFVLGLSGKLPLSDCRQLLRLFLVFLHARLLGFSAGSFCLWLGMATMQVGIVDSECSEREQRWMRR